MPEQPSDDRKIAFEVTSRMLDELNRVLFVTDLKDHPDIFCRAFTLLRIHVDAAQKGHQIFIVDPQHPEERRTITLPFSVSQGK